MYLACDSKLKPFVIFKLKTMSKEKFPPRIVVNVQPKVWCDEKGLHLWFEKVWNTRQGAAFNWNSLLVWNMFWAHLVDSIKAQCIRERTNQAIIPDDTMSHFTALKCESKLHMCRLWLTWMVEVKKEFTAGENLKKSHLQLWWHSGRWMHGL